MTSLTFLIVTGILALFLIYRSAVSDTYHSPLMVVFQVVLRTLSLLILAALILFWPWVRVLDEKTPVSGIILVDEAGTDSATINTTITQLETQVAYSGGKTILLAFNAADGSAVSQTAKDHGRFANLSSLITALKWLMLENPDAAVALISETYPGEFKSSPMENLKISWFRSENARKVDPVQVLVGPKSVFSGQMLSLEAKLDYSEETRQAVFSLNGDQQESKTVISSKDERPTVYFETTAGPPGINNLELMLLDRVGNIQSVHTWPVRTLPKPGIIYVSPSSRSAPLAQYLANNGIQIEYLSPYDLLSGTVFSPPDQTKDTVLILDSVPGPFYNQSVVASMYDAAHRLGFTLIVLPGAQTTQRDRGGPLERILPVKFGLEKSSETPTDLALVAMVDTSLSMFFNTDGISSFARNTSPETGLTTKISMAKKAIMNLAEALPVSDRFGVLAVTDKPSWIIKPSTPRDVGEEANLISRISAFGPGINLYSGLLASYNELASLDSEVKHILVFLDTADVDEFQVADRGTVWELLKDLREQKISVSLIGFGKTGDAHIPQLNRFAEESGGYFYLTSDIREIPGFGLMDLDQVTESLMNFQAREVEFFSFDFPGTDSFPKLWGQVMTTLKPGASLFAWSDRELPLVAAWPFGLGKVAIVTADGGQTLTKGWTDDPDAWLKILARIMSMRNEDAELFYTHSKELGMIYARADSSTAREGLSMVTSFPDGSRKSISMEKVAPGQFVTKLRNPYNGPHLLELKTANGDTRLAMQTLYPNPIANPMETLQTPPFNPVSARKTVSPIDPSDPLMLRLLIVLLVFLLVIDEMLRPPSMEEGES